MYLSLLVLIVIGSIVTAVVMLGLRFYRRSRHARLRRQPLPHELAVILEKRVSLYRHMPETLKAELHGYVNIFLEDKTFIGCDDLEITDEIRVVIAGNACVLLLNRSAVNFSGFSSILVYPDAYLAPTVSYDDGVETISHSARAGESWHRGPVVLSWGDVLRGSLNPDDGHNVVLHEFAHKVDEENGFVDGLPVLRDQGHYQDWADILTREFSAHRKRVRNNRNNVIDSYGAIAPAEFFAVATETFFERSQKMQQYLPDLYAQLQQFYGVDPASWQR